MLEIGFRTMQAVDARAIGDILVDRLRKRIRLLKDHADARAQFHHVDAVVVDILVVERDLAGDAAGLDRIVHAVEAAQESGLAAAGGADQCRHRIGTDLQIDIEERTLVAIENRNVLADHLVGDRHHLPGQCSFACGFRHHVHFPALPYQRRSKRRRSKIAPIFIATRKKSRTMMAPDVLSTKARSASLAHI